jgi:Lar family restriction alleviation protein
VETREQIALEAAKRIWSGEDSNPADIQEVILSALEEWERQRKESKVSGTASVEKVGLKDETPTPQTIVASQQTDLPTKLKVCGYRPYRIIARDPSESTYKVGDDKFGAVAYPSGDLNFQARFAAELVRRWNQPQATKETQRSVEARNTAATDCKSGELLPCPFCGDSHVTVSEYDTKDAWWTQCDNIHCGAEGPTRKTESEAINAWNFRILTARVAASTATEETKEQVWGEDDPGIAGKAI